MSLKTTVNEDAFRCVESFMFVGTEVQQFFHIVELGYNDVGWCDTSVQRYTFCGRLRLKCNGTRTETRFRFRRNRRVHLNRQGRQFSRLLAAELCASAVVMLDTPCSNVV